MKQKNLRNVSKILSLDAVIFTVLGTRYLLSVSEKQATPAFNAMIIVCIFLYILIDHQSSKYLNKLWFRIKAFTLVSIIFFLIFLPSFKLISMRLKGQNPIFIVDSAIVVEKAAEGLTKGTNPYEANYEDVLRNWPFKIEGAQKNPAFYHFPYLPTYPIINLFGYLIIKPILGFFDTRIISLIFLAATILLIFKFTKLQQNKFLFTILLVFNPVFLTSFLWGLNDIYIIFFILAFAYFFEKKRSLIAYTMLGLAITIKHSAWPILPFVLYSQYLKQKGKPPRKIFLTFKNIFPFFLTVSFILCPFIIWNAKAFIEDAWLYVSGGIPTSYPIGGYGVSELLLQMGFINNRTDYFPFIIFQVLISLPLTLILLHMQKKNNTTGQILFNYSILLMVLWYFSRFLNYNYIAFVSTLVTITFFISSESKQNI